MRIPHRLAFVVLCLFLLSLALASCGGTSGQAFGHRHSCEVRAGEGHCQGSYKRIKGTVSEDMASTSTFNGTEVLVTVTASVETGELRVFVKNEDGDDASMTIRDGKEGHFEQVVTVGGVGNPRLYFEVAGEEATGVSYTLDYEVQ